MASLTREALEKLIEEAWHDKRSTPADLRAAGLVMRMHSDLVENGKPYVYVAMSFQEPGSGRIKLFLEGTGPTDEAAFDEIRKQWAKYSDKRHHAPACPANHYHGMRAPTGLCNCGAMELDGEE